MVICRRRRAEVVVRDVVDEALAPAEPVDTVLVQVEPDHVMTDLDRADRQRQADVALADNDDPAVARDCHVMSPVLDKQVLASRSTP